MCASIDGVPFPVSRTDLNQTKIIRFASMKRKVHTESEMVKAVQELESGIDAEIVARNHGISKATLYNQKSKYRGMEVSQVPRHKELEEENHKLKQMYAELALDNKILKDVIENKLQSPRLELADEIVKEYNVSISRACKLMDIHKSYFYYTEKKDDSEVEQAIREAAEFGDGF